MTVFAFVGGLTTTVVVYALARHEGRTEVVTLVLTGVALNAIAGAATRLLIYLADDAQLRTITFWSLGSAGRATWRTVWAGLPFVALGLVLIPRWGRALNLLVLGEREALHLGVEPERVRLVLIGLTALMTGAAVALAVLHDLNLAAAYADRMAILCRGMLAAVDEPAKVLTEGLLAEVYGCPIAVGAHPVRGCPLVMPLPHRQPPARGDPD